VYNINTRHGIDLHFPQSNLTLFQKGAYYSRIKIFNHLPLFIKSLSHDFKQFKSALMKFLISNSFYSVEEFLNYKQTKDLGSLQVIKFFNFIMLLSLSILYNEWRLYNN
jgi:hypothetical protein